VFGAGAFAAREKNYRTLFRVTTFILAERLLNAFSENQNRDQEQLSK